jgi:hypothetical protein
MLRWILGDSLFFRGVRQYVNDPKVAYGFAKTEDLKINLEQEGNKNLTEFFNDWFMGQGYPSYTVKWSQNKNNWTKITVSQVTSHPSVSFFEMPLALKFKNGAQEKTVVVNNTENNEIFWQEIGFKADTVIIDPDYWVLSKNNVSIKEPDIPGDINEINVYPVPTSSSIVTLSIKNPVQKTMTISLINMAGQLISQQKLTTPGRDEEIQINISKLSAGVYLLHLDAGTFKTTRHIIKK